MPSVALTKSNTPIDAQQVAPAVWDQMKANARPGDYLMSCCRADAVLKTSVNGLHFFAHLNDECSTEPETAWHKEGKAIIVSGFLSIGLTCTEEVSGGEGEDTWQADTLVEVAGRRIVVELQRSYQTMEEYIRRQQRYARHNVECYWLTRSENMNAIAKKTGRLRMQREWGGKFPPGKKGFFPLIADFPVAVLEVGNTPMIWHVGNTQSILSDWLTALVEQRYTYDDGHWKIIQMQPALIAKV